MDGIFLFDKPQGLTSHKAISRLGLALGEKKVGHTGTLDPMATGLLICCFGRATRLSEYLIRADKTYEGEMTFGAVSDTYDADGVIKRLSAEIPADADAIKAVLATMTGEVEQEVPAYSAVKVEGKRLYDYARQGQTVKPPRRMVQIKSLELLDYAPPKARFTAKVSSGTYVRTICHEAGKKLGCGAYLSGLRRTRVGYYSVDNAITLEAAEADPKAALERLIPLQSALKHLPRVVLSEDGLKRFLHGGILEESDIKEYLPPRFGPHLPVQVVDRANFYGIMERKRGQAAPPANVDSGGADAKPGIYYKPSKVFHPVK